MQIRTQVACFVLFLAILLASSLVQSQVRSDSPAPLAPRQAADAGAFYSALSQHFQVSSDQIEAMVARGLSPAQVVVVCFIARHSLRSADEILADRRAGGTWRQIAIASGLQPELFYYPLPFAHRQPFVNVYALFHQAPRHEWSWETLPLRDSDVENLVNLRFVAELTGRQSPEVMRLRAAGLDYVTIHSTLLAGQQTAQAEPWGDRRVTVSS